jgi:hypothetical protein
MDEDFSWSEVPRKRAALTVVEPPPLRFEREVEEVHPRALHPGAVRYDADGYEEDGYDYGFDDDDADFEVEDIRAEPRAGAIQLPADGRRTIVITGHGADHHPAPRTRRESSLRIHERSGFRPERMALWAFLLGLALVLGATTSSHAAVLTHLAH